VGRGQGSPDPRPAGVFVAYEDAVYLRRPEALPGIRTLVKVFVVKVFVVYEDAVTLVVKVFVVYESAVTFVVLRLFQGSSFSSRLSKSSSSTSQGSP
jgi:hypothetical protein